MRAFRFLGAVLTAALLAVLLTFPVGANSAEPPNLIVLVTLAPDDLQLQLEFPGYTKENGEPAVYEPDLETKVWERSYRFFARWGDLPEEAMEHAQLRVTSGGASYTLPVPAAALDGYNNLLSLNWKTQELRGEESMVLRTPLLIAMRVTLTLALEGLVFYLAGYRQKRSWCWILIVNLITQGLLNLAIQGPNSAYAAYLVLLLGEPLIFIVESLVFAFALKEQRPLPAGITTVLANLVSLVAGGYMMLHFPT